ncbi:sigma factor-like helix-turn-helix DNA-binding protein [Oceanobacillus locisalsi]|uniref:Sigma factor-like helix-turn-helix DNA-binding protein n=1 Tax=Oceanobacillus locisalsi TaxID=546107 RepID=A0ABW3NCE3_9BACI
MHQNTKQHKSSHFSDLLMIDFHHFLQMEKTATYLEIATELGISIEEIKQLKKRTGRS